MLRRILNRAHWILSVALVFSVVPSSQVVGAPHATFGIENAVLKTNKGLEVCTQSTTKACIESIAIDGVTLSYTSDTKTADVLVRGMLFGSPCRFELEATPQDCEYPYFSIRPRGTDNRPLGDVTLKLRRNLGESQNGKGTGYVITNGDLLAFTPSSSWAK